MRIPRFYIDRPLELGLDLALPNEIHRHAIQVLRLKKEEVLILFNGEGGEYLAKLTLAEKRKSKAKIVSFDATNRESPLQITLALAILKGDKMDFALQKAVEMGVQSIYPLYTQRSVIRYGIDRMGKKLAHWEGIIKAACEQSGRTSIPLLYGPTLLHYWLTIPYSGLQIAMLPEQHSSISALDAPKNNKVSLIVGPEGGFTDEEVHLLLDSSVKGIRFGPRILRAETATIAGIALCQQQWGDLDKDVP
ncbi:MAG: 16S rRNA (uracil(1498)-N(3))-methyltransferase [Cocleimonas sp.]|nr:16S rRNA (uracil(1498)-N(3))-methyltransferase [Cocleimonas sp.]